MAHSDGGGSNWRGCCCLVLLFSGGCCRVSLSIDSLSQLTHSVQATATVSWMFNNKMSVCVGMCSAGQEWHRRLLPACWLTESSWCQLSINNFYLTTHICSGVHLGLTSSHLLLLLLLPAVHICPFNLLLTPPTTSTTPSVGDAMGRTRNCHSQWFIHETCHAACDDLSPNDTSCLGVRVYRTYHRRLWRKMNQIENS